MKKNVQFTIVHFEDFLVSIQDEAVVHSNFSVFIFNHGNFLSMICGQDVVQESRFSGAI